MTIAVPVLAIGLFAGVWLRRLKRDIEQEREFRARLSGLPLSEHLPA